MERENQTKETLIGKYRIIEYEKSHVYIIENILDPAFCDEIRVLLDTLPLLKTEYSDGNNVLTYVADLKELVEKGSFEERYMFSLQTNLMTTNAMNGISYSYMNEIIRRLEKETFPLLTEIMKDICVALRFEKHSGLLGRKIYGPTRLHSDGIKGSNYGYGYDVKKERPFFYINPDGTTPTPKEDTTLRNCSAVFTLNDDYEGGVFRFPEWGIETRLKKGSLLLFPPFYTHKHEVSGLELVGGGGGNTKPYRYTIQTWFLETP